MTIGQKKINSGDILIVDDQPENLRVLAQILADRGYNVRKAINGNLAVMSAQANPPDVILLDIKMPEMDGYQVCRRLKNNPMTAEIPVIFISALDDILDKVKAFEVGGIDYMTKPFQEEEVIARINSQLTIQKQKRELQEEITKRRETEEALYQSRALINSVLNSSLDGIIALQAVRDLTGKIADFRCILVNPIISQILGINRDNLIGKIIVKKIMRRLRSDLFDAFVEVVKTGQPLEQDFYYQNNNTERWYHFIAVKLGDGFAVTVRDITERKLTEINLAKTNQQLIKQTSQLKALNKELESFSFRVCHDLRNPLSNIYGLVELMILEYGDQLDQQVLNYLELIKQSGKKINAIIEGLMILAKVDQENRKMVIDNVNLSTIIAKIVQRLRQNDPQRKVEFIIDPEAITQGDQRLLEIALDNLLSNAWKYTSKREKAVIEFRVLSPNNEVDREKLNVPQDQILSSSQLVYCIKDNGAGFDMNKADTIFTPFERLHSQAEFEGTGIGLSTVQRIIHRHGGLIWCYSEVNRGASFYFTLDSN